MNNLTDFLIDFIIAFWALTCMFLIGTVFGQTPNGFMSYIFLVGGAGFCVVCSVAYVYFKRG